MSDEVLEAVQHLANCQGPCMDGKSLRLVREYIRDAESQNQALQDERDSLIGDIADSWAPRVEALQERAERAEDARTMLAEMAFTAPDADWNTMLDSLRARVADAVARAKRAEAALREIVETPAEVEFQEGDCAYCESKSVARNALSPTQETDPG